MDSFKDQLRRIESQAGAFLFAVRYVGRKDEPLNVFWNRFSAVMDFEDGNSLFVFPKGYFNRIGKIFRFDRVFQQVFDGALRSDLSAWRITLRAARL